MSTYKTLIVYRKAYSLALEIHTVTKSFPRSEMFGLISQIRRASKSVCANFAECYTRRRYRKFFQNKLSECLSENNETAVWLYFAKDLKYLTEEKYEDLYYRNTEIGKMLGYMLLNPEKFS